AIQVEYNKLHKITPQKISKPIREKLIDEIIEEKAKGQHGLDDVDYAQLPPPQLKRELKRLTEMMKYEAELLNFEKAAALRDKLREVKKYEA
ncbi:MAG: UvrABC system protein B, partial [candidate division WWE3 bacterium GW2011_GWB1_47_11]